MDKPTIKDIKESISFMRKRYEEGQGGLDQAMCRLSLRMSEFLLEQYEKAQENYQFMVNKAFDEKYPAYEELGQKLMAMEDRAWKAEAEVRDLAKKFVDMKTYAESLEMKLGIVCPECKGYHCKGATDDAMLYGKGESCPTYWDGCHCCNTCAGYPKCEHGKWATERCEECK